ncbi:MAG: putative FAD-dependent dehydrogenase [Lysobacterales bacterium]|jgi:uncharacterized FAD-dependent dehydrogenase
MTDEVNNNFIRIDEIALTLDQEESVIEGKILKILEVRIDDIEKHFIIKRAVDSRKKDNILLTYSVGVYLNDPQRFLSKKKQSLRSIKKKTLRHKIRLQAPYHYEIAKTDIGDEARPVIVGAGPSGLFCALVLAEAGLKPLLIERGVDVPTRVRDIKEFFKTGELQLNSNIQFGEGGAGTFSDGKLYTNIKSSRIKYIFEEFIKAGAPPRIATDAHPHIGTDRLRPVVINLRKKVIELGGEVRFSTRLTDLEIKDGKVVAAIFDGQERIVVKRLVLAMGHSGRDTYEMLYKHNLQMKPKSFAIGVRIEHSRESIDKAQYGDCACNEKLPTARYKLVAHLKENRSVYTFCMCPGGYVVNSCSEEGMMVVNGMSKFTQKGPNSNSALLVNVLPEDFGSDHPLAGVQFQRHWEHQAFLAGGSDYKAPAQLVGDFLENKPSTAFKSVESSYEPSVKLTSLESCLPDFVLKSIKESLPVFDSKIKGFNQKDAVLVGIESRSSAPVRFTRDESLQSNIQGIYPIGEGAGFAGGIVSSGVDGMKAAESIITALQK